ncbi:hypothetical protein LCGC14_1305800 [marine sediment metagenome]|uniref:Uncharacterized protein n=1 Tax=marine sediment metagenome TaxID=412755 RepID=A0A0F9NRG4_9ZZZZ
MTRRRDSKFAFNEADLEPDRVIVSTVEHKGNLYIATQKGIYRLEDDKMVRLQLIDKGVENEQT